MGQRVVLLTLRVNEEKGYVDLSLRRVNGEQKANKMNEWRYATKVENLLKFFAEQNKITLEEIYAKAIFPLIDKYGDIRTALETIKDEGKTVLDNTPGFNLPQNIKDAFCKLIEENVSIHKISITAEYEIRSFQGNGINIIKDAILSAAKIRRPKGLDLKFYYIGAPIYRCVIEAEDYRTAEKFLEKVTKKIESTILPEGSIEVHRDNLSNEQKGAQI